MIPAEPSAQPGDEFLEISDQETDWLERFNADPAGTDEKADAAKALIDGTGTTGPGGAIGDHFARNRGQIDQGNRGADGVVAAAGEGAGLPGAGAMKKLLEKMVREKYL